MSRFLYFCLIVFLCSSCYTGRLKRAERKYNKKEYSEAAIRYRKLYAKTSPKQKEKRGYLAFREGDCYRLTHQTTRATNAYQKAVLNKYFEPILLFRLAQVWHASGEYEKAAGYYSDYLRIFPRDLLAMYGLIGSEKSPEKIKHPSRYQVNRLQGINSGQRDFSPMLNRKGQPKLTFTSSRENRKSGKRLSHLYESRLGSDNSWTIPEKSDIHHGRNQSLSTPAFTPNGQQMYYTVSSRNRKGLFVSQIYYAELLESGWSEGIPVPLWENTEWATAHPAISPDGRYLYFVSDQPAGYGGKDIYKAQLFKKGETGEPMNLGPDINTPGDELFPYVRDNGILYFSSDGLPGFGGFDIFTATPDESGNWLVTNHGYPINSPGNDFGITFYPGEEKGYFSSNRDDIRGHDHIYSFHLPPLDIRLEGYILDNEGSPISNADLQTISKDGNMHHIMADRNGFYSMELRNGMEYLLLARADGYFNQHINFTTQPDEKDEMYILDFYLYAVGESIPIKTLYYGVNQFNLNQPAEKELEEVIRLLEANPHLQIEITGHTDRTGTDEFNHDLSEKRASSVATYLINNGINKERLSVKGYGNDPLYMTTSDHLNRRVEINITTGSHLF